MRTHYAGETVYDRAWGIDADNESIRRDDSATRTFYNSVLALGRGFGKVSSIADLSCGSGDYARTLGQESGVEPVLGDLGEGYPIEGPLSETVGRLPIVDLYICTETVEHLEDPDKDLALVRKHTRGLLLSTPVNEPEPLAEGHLWTWSHDDVEEMLEKAGFTVEATIWLYMPGWYDHCSFGIWACR